MLAPDGLLVLAVRMRRVGAGKLDPSRYGCSDEHVASVVATLESVGFREISTRRADFGRETVTAILARR